jgi:hypothetical protein
MCFSGICNPFPNARKFNATAIRPLFILKLKSSISSLYNAKYETNDNIINNAENVWGRNIKDKVPSSFTSVSTECLFNSLNRVFVGGPEPEIPLFRGESILEIFYKRTIV